jgi:hypothetical protein
MLASSSVARVPPLLALRMQGNFCLFTNKLATRLRLSKVAFFVINKKT